MKPSVLTLLAHPDDAEILCGGLLCLLADRGWTIHIATATPGDCGSSSLPPDEIAALRRAEAGRAAAMLGGEYHCLESRDLRVFYGAPMLDRACDLLRRARPSLVITHSPQDYMIDHEECSRIARASCFNAPIPNAPSAGDGARAQDRPPPLERVPHLYYADPIGGCGIFGQAIEPSRIADVSSVLERKAAILACHESQRTWLRSHHGIDEYIEAMRRWSRERGALAGVAAGEGFRQHLGHAYPESDLLGEVLGDLWLRARS